MKFSINQREFLSAINIVQKGISGKNLMEVLKGIHIETEDGHLILTTNNLELGIITKVKADIKEEGNVLIDGRIIFDIIRKLPNEDLNITLIDDVLNIKSSNAKFNIKSMYNDRYPLLEEYDETKYETIDSKIFVNMIRKTNFAASTDESRGVITGELLEVEDNSINMVAIDGFRFALKKIDTNFNLEPRRVVIPSKTLLEISKIIDTSEKFGILFEEKNVSFKVNDTIINSRLLDGDFIDYKKIIPNEFSTTIKVNNKEFIDSLERAQLVSNNNLVILEISEENLKISSKNTEVGNLEESLSIELKGKDLKIAFNIKYFLEALKNIEDEYIFMNFNTNISPCVIQPENEKDYIYLVLPVRI